MKRRSLGRYTDERWTDLDGAEQRSDELAARQAALCPANTYHTAHKTATKIYSAVKLAHSGAATRP